MAAARPGYFTEAAIPASTAPGHSHAGAPPSTPVTMGLRPKPRATQVSESVTISIR